MKHVYVTVRDQFVIDELLRGDVDAIRRPFRVLLDPGVFSQLLNAGADGWGVSQTDLERRRPTKC